MPPNTRTLFSQLDDDTDQGVGVAESIRHEESRKTRTRLSSPSLFSLVVAEAPIELARGKGPQVRHLGSGASSSLVLFFVKATRESALVVQIAVVMRAVASRVIARLLVVACCRDGIITTGDSNPAC